MPRLHSGPREELFWPKVQKTRTCWLWTAALSKGYGIFNRGKGLGTTGAHRVAWELLRGPVPKGMTLDHLCRIRHCVNPDHLEIVTRAENVLRGISPNAINARKTHCMNGHEFSPANTYINPTSGSRACRTCMHNRYLRRRDAA